MSVRPNKNTVQKILADFKNVHILLNIAGIWQKLSQLEEIDPNTIQILFKPT